MIGREVDTAAQYEESPSGWAKRWQVELDAAHKATDAFRREGQEAEQRYQAEEKRAQGEGPDRRWNLWYAGVSTQHALLFDQVPKVSVSRKHGDAADDVARVASIMLERLLNGCVDENDSYTLGLGQSLLDLLLTGLGVCRVRLERDMETVQALGADGVTPVEVERVIPGSERVEVDYLHWEDVRWSAGARVWQEVEWVAFASLLSRRQLVERFGPDLGVRIPLNERQGGADEAESPHDRARVWEIWDKGTRHVYCHVEGFTQTLGGPEAPEAGRHEDPLGLQGFFPCPRPMLANAITKRVRPKSDYGLVRDLLGEIDMLQARLYLLAEAVRVAGVFDRNNADIARLIKEAGFNDLIPVDRWNAFVEGGGVRGAIDWLPLEPITAAMAALEQRQERLKLQVYEVTGMSDILRGQGQGPGVTFGEQALKARFASARLRQLQKEFARFASDLARLRAEVLCGQDADGAPLVQDGSLLMLSNLGATVDASIASQALQLLRSPARPYRVQVKPESLALSDFSQRQDERTGVLGMVGTLMQGMAPILQMMPEALPHLLRLMQWGLTGVPGGDEVEGIFDAAIAQAQQPRPPPQQAPQAPDPKLLVQQMKGQQDMNKVQAELQADLQRTAAEVQADAAREQVQHHENVAEARDKAIITQQVRAMGGQPT